MGAGEEGFYDGLSLPQVRKIDNGPPRLAQDMEWSTGHITRSMRNHLEFGWGFPADMHAQPRRPQTVLEG